MTNNGLQGLTLQNYQPLRDVVFEHLRNSILKGELKPKERLMEVQLAQQLGVSRTPVREAIRKLELEGLVVMIARKGAYVADLSVKDILDVIEVRSVLEGLATSLAAERMTEEEIEELELISYNFKRSFENQDKVGMIEKDMEFHDAILRASRNPKLLQITQGLQEQVQRFRITYFSEYSQSKNLLKEHQDILNAIVNRDVGRSQKVAQYHVEQIGSSFMHFADGNKNKI